MKSCAFELTTTGKKVDDDELKDYILNSLDGDYNPLIASINIVPSTTLTEYVLSTPPLIIANVC